MAYTYSTTIKLGSKSTGLTLKAQIFDNTNAQIGSDITTGFTELSGGEYYWTYASMPNGQRGYIKFLNGSTYKTALMIDALQEYLDAKVSGATAPTAATVASAVWEEVATNHSTVGTTGKALQNAGLAGDPLSATVPGTYATGTAGAALGRIGTGQIINRTAFPVTSSGDMRLIKNADYNATDNRALPFKPEADSDWPDLSGASITLKVNEVDDSATLFTATGSVISASTAKQVQVSLTAANTNTLTADRQYSYYLYATISGRVNPLATGIVYCSTP